MRSVGKPFYAYRFDATKLPFKFALAVLLMVAASLVGAQTLQTIYSLNFPNGVYPYAALTLGNDGNFYGTTANGCTGNGGYS